MKNRLLIWTCALLTFLNCQSQVQISGVINTYASVLAIQDCPPALTVDNATGFTPGLSLILIQMKGADFNSTPNETFGQILSLNQAGLFERVTIDSIFGNRLFLTQYTKNTYDLNMPVQVVSYPQFKSAIITADLSCPAWDGKKGGIIAFQVTDTLNMQANVIADGKGFRGGESQLPDSLNCNPLVDITGFAYLPGDWKGSPKGETMIQVPLEYQNGRGAMGSGGGGGNDHKSGGGGGGNITGGGNGGKNNATSMNCQGDYPGLGAHNIKASLQIGPDRIFFGGGGGAGHCSEEPGTNGGNGGGIIFAELNYVVGNNRFFSANGIQPTDANTAEGAGGGGAGGTVLISAKNLKNKLRVLSTGGKGGNTKNTNSFLCVGPGGGGSGGRILTNLLKNPNFIFDYNGGNPGTSTNSQLGNCNGSNDAAAGLDGTADTVAVIPNIWQTNPAIQITQQPASYLQVCTNQSYTIKVSAQGNLLQYRWQRKNGTTFQQVSDGPLYNGSKTSNLKILKADASFNGAIFRCRIVDGCGRVNYSREVKLEYAQTPSASFSASIEERNVQFTQTEVLPNTVYVWDFGDGSNQVAKANPFYTYQSDGKFQVVLNATNSCGSPTEVKEIEINSVKKPTANFMIQNPEGCTPHNVSFLDQSTDQVANWKWIFIGGNPAISTQKNPVVEYTTPGTFEVRLIVSNKAGSDSLFMQNAVTIDPQPNALFSYFLNSNKVNTVNQSVNADSFEWNFGDGSALSTEKAPVHAYQVKGEYTIVLKAINDCGFATYTQKVNVQLIDAVDLEENFALRAFPNPFSDKIHLAPLGAQSSPVFDWSLWNISGQVIRQGQDSIAPLEIETLDLLPGMYFLLVRNVTGSAVVKLAKP